MNDSRFLLIIDNYKLTSIGILFLSIFVLLPGKLLPIFLQPYCLSISFLYVASKILLVSWMKLEDSHHLRIQLSDNPLTLSFLLILLCLPLSIWISYSRDTSWISAGYLLFGVVLYWWLLEWKLIQNSPQFLAWLWLLFSVVFSFFLLPVVAWKPEFRLFYLPIYEKIQLLPFDLGETIHANVFAGFLILLLPLLIALSLQKKHQFLFLFLFSMLAAILMLTQSRSAYVAFLTTLPLIIILRWPYFRFVLLIISIIAIACFINYFDIQIVLDQLSADASLGGWDGRLIVWYNSLQAISDFAYTGIGIGTFTIILPLLYPLNLDVEDYPHAHNLFLQIGLDLGLPGLIAYLAMLIILFVMLISTLRNPYTLPLHRTLAIGATGSLVGMLVHGLLDAVTWGTKLAFVPWILFALITQLFLYTQATQAAYKATSELQNKPFPDK